MSVANVRSYWSSGNLIFTEKVIGNGATVEFGVDDDGIDVYFRGATSGAYVLWDESANTLKFVGGATIDGGGLTSYSLSDDVDLNFGDSNDVTMQWDTAATPDQFQIACAADDTVFNIGIAAATQRSFDIRWYGNEANGASYLYADASANLIYTTGIDLQFKDNDYLVFGSGAGATGDVQITWDTTNLLITATADDSVIEIGDAAETQNSFDVKIYGNAASGADYLLWDASASALTTAGAAVIAGRIDDANGIGLTLSVKTTASAPGETGTPTGSIVYNTNDHKIYIYDGAAWYATSALSSTE